MDPIQKDRSKGTDALGRTNGRDTQRMLLGMGGVPRASPCRPGLLHIPVPSDPTSSQARVFRTPASTHLSPIRAPRLATTRRGRDPSDPPLPSLSVGIPILFFRVRSPFGNTWMTRLACPTVLPSVPGIPPNPIPKPNAPGRCRPGGWNNGALEMRPPPARGKGWEGRRRNARIESDGREVVKRRGRKEHGRRSTGGSRRTETKSKTDAFSGLT